LDGLEVLAAACTRFHKDADNLLILGTDNAPYLGATEDEKFKISATDTTANYVLNKILAGTNVTITQNNPASNETITIAANDMKTIENNTAGVGSPNILLSTEKGKFFTNTGTPALNYHTLPTAAAGTTFTFIVTDANGIVITANAGDVITIGGSSSTAAGTATSTTLGSVVNLVAIDATTWHSFGHTGTWVLA
jgi:hypothetical protein